MLNRQRPIQVCNYFKIYWTKNLKNKNYFNFCFECKGIEWKPIVDNEENQTPKKISPDPESTTSTSATSDTHKKSSTSPDSTADSDLVKSKTQRSQNRRVIDSSTSCSQSSAGSSSDNEEEKSKKQTQKTAEELIFTPLISYEKKIAPVVAIEKSSPIKKVVEGSLPTEEDETTIEVSVTIKHGIRVNFN